jgi:recombinational DNA repair protein RecT
VEALLTKWLPTAIEMEKPLKADRELIAALQQAKQALDADQAAEDDDTIPF